MASTTTPRLGLGQGHEVEDLPNAGPTRGTGTATAGAAVLAVGGSVCSDPVYYSSTYKPDIPRTSTHTLRCWTRQRSLLAGVPSTSRARRTVLGRLKDLHICFRLLVQTPHHPSAPLLVPTQLDLADPHPQPHNRTNEHAYISKCLSETERPSRVPLPRGKTTARSYQRSSSTRKNNKTCWKCHQHLLTTPGIHLRFRSTLTSRGRASRAGQGKNATLMLTGPSSARRVMARRFGRTTSGIAPIFASSSL